MREIAFIKTTTTLLLLLASATTTMAQGKLDLESRMTLMKERSTNVLLPTPQEWGQEVAYAKGLTSEAAKHEQRSHMMAFVEMNGSDAIQRLQEAGVIVMRTRGDIALTSIPTDKVEAVSDMECVKRVQLARKVQKAVNNSRIVTGIDKIHSGEALPQAYTGKGVVCGIIDNGFDPNHVNFLKPDGTTRFGYMSNIYASSSSSDGYVYEDYYPRAELTDSEEPNTYAIEDFKTDDKTDYHGTHTLGIMAGGYKGNVKAATLDGDAANIAEMENPYYGVATESEIVASTGDFDTYDMFICYGLDDCINYSLYSNGATDDGMPVKEKPCVINMSIGRILGPHDKNGLLNQYLAAAGESEAIICMAAGNEADYPICLHKTFTAEDKTLQSFIKPIEEGEYEYGAVYHNLRYGSMYVYGSDEREFEIQLVVYNQKRGSVAMRIPVSTNTNGSYVVYASSNDYADGATINANFQKAFDGYIAVGTMLDEETGRYYAVVYYLTSDNQETNADGNYLLGLIVNGKEGQKVDVYGDAQFTYFDSYGLEKWQDGTRDGTISDLAIGDNVIVVGSWNNNTSWANLDGSKGDFDGELPYGEASQFSSFGTLDDGTTLPHICAPGTAVVSSANGYFVDYKNNGVTDAYLQASTEANGRNQYWLTSTGTSMSCPLVAGAIATWLEADPTLVYADVIDIIKTTAKRDEYVREGNAAQWGAGKFDAYAGLQEVLRRKELAGIRQVKSEKREVKNPSYNLQGQRVNDDYKGLIITNGKKYIKKER